MNEVSNFSQSYNKKVNVHKIIVFIIGIYMMLLPFEYVLTSESGTINKYIGLLIIGLCFISGTFRNKINLNYFLLIILLVYGLVSLTWATSPAYWNQIFLVYLKNALLFFAVAQCKFTKKECNTFLNFYVVGSLLLALYLVTSSSIVVDAYSGRTVIAVNGGYFDPNYMAADIIIPIGYMYGVFFDKIVNKKYAHAILAIVIILILFYIEILSGSRGGLLSIVAMICIITLLNIKNKAVRKKIIFIVLIAIVAISFIMQMIPEDILERFSLDSLLGKTDSGSGRLDLWSAAFKGIKNNWFLGYGAGCAIPAVGMYHGINRASHSLYLSSYLEFGIFSLLLYISLFSEITKAYKKKLYMEVGISIGILIASIFIDSLSTKFFWTFLIILFTRNKMEVAYDEKN